MSEFRKFSTVEEIISAKMEQRLTIGGISQEDCDLLDEFLGGDHSVSPLPGRSSLAMVRGVPSGGHRTVAEDGLSPPTTNRGVTKHACNQAESPDLSFGGFDGGVEIGFEGDFEPEQFTNIKSSLQSGKELASDSDSGTALIDICGHTVSVDACGANAGLHYRFKFKLNGVTFFVHHNAPKGRQAVRVRYGAMALIGRSLYDVHATVLTFLHELGFTVTKEVVSRVDLQVTLGIDILELLEPIYLGCAVSRSRDDVLYRNRGVERTHVVGHRGRIQQVAYDKNLEMRKMQVSNPAKFQLMVDEHFDGNFSFDIPLTRIEYRLWRDVLRLLEINTIADLRTLETDLVAWLTNTWFRILSVPKDHVKGHEKETAIDPRWQQVQAAFLHFFPGEGRAPVPIKFNRDKPISCEATSLLKQAKGCLKTALALMFGVQTSVENIYETLFAWADSIKHELFEGTNERAFKLKVLTGLNIQDSLDPETLLHKKEEIEKWLEGLTHGRKRALC